MATLGLSEARLAQTRVSRCPEASSALPLSPNLDSLHVLFVGGRGGPAGRSTGHTHRARHRLAAAVGSAPAREAGPFGMGESEARAAHAGDRGDRPPLPSLCPGSGLCPLGAWCSHGSLRTLLSLGGKPSTASAQSRGSERRGSAEKPAAPLAPLQC